MNGHYAVACAFDLLILNGEDFRRKPYMERKSAQSRFCAAAAAAFNTLIAMRVPNILQLHASLAWKELSQRE